MHIGPITPGFNEWYAMNAERRARGEEEIPLPDFPSYIETEADIEQMDAALAELASYAPPPESDPEPLPEAESA